MSQDRKVGINGHVKVKLIGADGKVKQEYEGSNIITDVGLEEIARALAADSFGAHSHMAIGDDNTAVAAGDTTMTNETARVALDSTTRTTNSVAYVATFPAGTGTGTVEEAGVFDAASVGNMLCHFLTTTFTKGAGDALELTWTITIARA